MFIICRSLNRRPGLQTYKGSRVFTVNGSTLVLPDTPELWNHFGMARYEKEKDRAMAKTSIHHDVLNRATWAAIID